MPVAALIGLAVLAMIASSWLLNRDALRAAVEAQIRAVTGLDLVVKGNTDPKGTTKVAEEYLKYLYSDEAQKLIAKNGYRPINPKAADPEDLKKFVDLQLITIDDPIFGGWAAVTPKHFADGGVFDQIYQPGK